MKYLMLILLVASTTVGAQCRMIGCAEGETGSAFKETLPNEPTTGVGNIQSPLGTSISAPSGPPSAQHLKLVAEAQARAEESARQWWINFFNNK